jgi:hypothetical protein
MCPCGQATIGTGLAPDQADGCTLKEDRWEGSVPVVKNF